MTQEHNSILIGLGSGRSGTASLAKLINHQQNAHCFHELNPSCVAWSGTWTPIKNTINEFNDIIQGKDTHDLTVDLSRPTSLSAYHKLQKKREIALIGDIAHYYLYYVESIANLNHKVRFICLQRDKEATVQSWIRKSKQYNWRSAYLAAKLSSWLTRTPFTDSLNHWIDHDGTQWAKDDVWDKCFPKFPAETMVESIGQYWDFYYEKARILEEKLSGIFKIIPLNELNDRARQDTILAFAGIPENQRLYLNVHENPTGREAKTS